MAAQSMTSTENQPRPGPARGRPRGTGPGPADGRARRDHREHRAALGPARSGFSDADRQWVVTAYALAFGGLLLLGGRLADMLGRRRMFLIGLVGFAVASALGGAAANFATLLGGARRCRARSARCSPPRRCRC